LKSKDCSESRQLEKGAGNANKRPKTHRKVDGKWMVDFFTCLTRPPCSGLRDGLRSAFVVETAVLETGVCYYVERNP
jgi:hypothetical protein